MFINFMCIYTNSSASLINNTTLWHYLDIEHLDFGHKNNSTQGHKKAFKSVGPQRLNRINLYGKKLIPMEKL